MNTSTLQPSTKLEEPVLVTEDEVWEAAEYIMKAMANTRLRDSLDIIRHNGTHIKRNLRSFKIKEQLLLRGKWLQKAGFQPGNRVWVLPFEDLLIVIPQEGLKK